MTDEYTLEIQKKLEALPPDVRKLVYSAEMESVLRQIGTKNQLHVDKIGLLESETVAVMIGISKAEDFVQNLSDSLNIDEIKSRAIANDVNSMLLLKIRESMKNLSQPARPAVPVKITTSVAPPPPPPAPKAIEPHPADMMLAQKTISVAPATPKPTTIPPITPQPYKADPYREPTE